MPENVEQEGGDWRLAYCTPQEKLRFKPLQLIQWKYCIDGLTAPHPKTWDSTEWWWIWQYICNFNKYDLQFILNTCKFKMRATLLILKFSLQASRCDWPAGHISLATLDKKQNISNCWNWFHWPIWPHLTRVLRLSFQTDPAFPLPFNTSPSPPSPSTSIAWLK